LKNNKTPKRKRLKRAHRLTSSKEWIKKYYGKNIVKGYAKWYGVDLICAIKELRMIDVHIPLDYEEQVKQSIEANKMERQLKCEKRCKLTTSIQDYYSNDEFEYIAGFTSSGFPYGTEKGEINDIGDL
jgi:hypothetical protein